MQIITNLHSPKSYLFKILIFLLFSSSYAQVGINTTSPAGGSLLDVESSDKGILVPRVNIADLSTIAPVSGGTTESLLVYNTNTTTGKGFYYWDGAQWVGLSATPSDDWTTTGNSGTTAGTNFVGTTDNEDLVLAVNGTEEMRILSGDQVSVNDATPIAGDRFTVVGDANEFAVNGYGTGASGVGIYGETTTGIGVYGLTSSTGQGVRGFNSGSGWGVAGRNSNSGRGVIGFAESTGTGVQAQTTGSNYALAAFNTGTGPGIYNDVAASFGIANIIRSNSIGLITDLTTAGGLGEFIDLDVQDGDGVVVVAVDDTTTPTNGGDGFSFFSYRDTTTPTISNTVSGAIVAGDQYGVGHGILINHSGSEGRNAEFNIQDSNNPDPAMFSIHQGDGSVIIGQNQNDSPAGDIVVADFSYTGTDRGNHIGVSGSSITDTSRKNGIGVQGTGGEYGVLGIDAGNSGGGSAYGVFSNGDFGGTGAKYFVIDHPQDPANKYLRHANIESNEVLNLYRGVEQFDSNGQATVQLPDYYSVINKNPSYQVTPIGAAMPNLYIAREIENNVFVIAGGVPGKKVSWIVTSERNDPYMQQNPESRQVVIDKGEKRGKYLMPQLYGQSKERGVFYKENKNEEGSKLKTVNSLKERIGELPTVEAVEVDESAETKKRTDN